MEILADNPVVQILINRDNLSAEEAIDQVQECADNMYNALINGTGDPEDII